MAFVEQGIKLSQQKSLLPPPLRERDPFKRFTSEEKLLLAQTLQDVWTNDSERARPDAQCLNFPETTHVCSYVDGELRVTINSELKERFMHEQPPVFINGNIQTPAELMALRALLRRLNKPNTTLFTQYFPYQRGDRIVRTDGFEEVPLIEDFLCDISDSGVQRIVLVDSHSPAFARFALEYGIRVLDVSALPMLFSAAHNAGILAGHEVCSVSGDDGAREQGMYLAEYAQHQWGYNCMAHLEGEKVKVTKPDGRRKVTIEFPPEQLKLIRGRIAVIAEDIVSTGGTLAGCIGKLLEAGAAHVVVLVTFPIFAPPALELLGNNDRITIVTTGGRTPLAGNFGDAHNIIQLPLEHSLQHVATLEQMGVDFWSEEGQYALGRAGLCLAPWQTHRTVNPCTQGNH